MLLLLLRVVVQRNSHFNPVAMSSRSTFAPGPDTPLDAASLHTLNDIPSATSPEVDMDEKAESLSRTLSPAEVCSPKDAGVVEKEKAPVCTLEGEVVLGDVEVQAIEAGEDEDYPEGGRGWWVVAGCAMLVAGALLTLDET